MRPNTQHIALDKIQLLLAPYSRRVTTAKRRSEFPHDGDRWTCIGAPRTPIEEL